LSDFYDSLIIIVHSVRVPNADQPVRDAIAAPARLSLVMPMAGRGSRFAGSEVMPKPLIDLCGKPFFWWAVESVRRIAPLDELVFVVLEDHVREFAIDARVRDYYPQATIKSLREVTSGAAETAAIGVAALQSVIPVAVCDSDHGFDPGDVDLLADFAGRDGLLLCFESRDPAYSFACVDASGDVTHTVEKQVVSNDAIAGCYLFSSPRAFLDAWDRYRSDCSYDELFVSGLYNTLIQSGGRVGRQMLHRHVSFGTPAEFARAETQLARESLWAA
jgi:dTDP-glucose pyrophosphorylase